MLFDSEDCRFGSKFNDNDQEKDERRGFRGGGGGFSKKGFGRRESSDSIGKSILTILWCIIHIQIYMYNYIYVIIIYYDIVDETGNSNKGEETTCWEVYIPTPPPDDENSIFKTIDVSINFDRYDKISVDMSGCDPPHNISSFEEFNFLPEISENFNPTDKRFILGHI